jgi:hypothetical protein
MKPRLLFLPPVYMSPESCRSIAALNRFLETLDAPSDVDVYRWSWIKGAARVDSSIPAQAEAVRERLSPGCHVIASGGATGICLVALNGQAEIASFVSFGLALPAATLKTLGHQESLARVAAFEAMLSAGSYQFLRASMQGAEDKEIIATAESLDANLEMEALRDTIHAYFQYDLARERPDIRAPTLFLLNKSEFMGDTTGEFFSQLVPHAQVLTGHSWNDRHHEERAGIEAAHLVLGFIDRLQRPALDEEAHLLSIANKEIQLTPLEYGLFSQIHKRAGAVVSRQDLLEKVWGYDYMGGANVVDVTVLGLRKKLGDHASLIETVRGAGYRYNPPPGLI